MTQIEHPMVAHAPTAFKWDFKTKYHENLGDDLQAALDVLEREGWQVVTSFYSNSRGARIILTRIPR